MNSPYGLMDGWMDRFPFASFPRGNRTTLSYTNVTPKKELGKKLPISESLVYSYKYIYNHT